MQSIYTYGIRDAWQRGIRGCCYLFSRGGGVRVGCKVNEAEVDDELDDLDSCDPFFPPDADSTGSLEVIPVHDDVDSQIECNWNIALW